jgi:hypothetical protein
MVPVQTMLDMPQTPDVPMSQAVPIVGELIPIVAIVLGIGFVMLRVYLDFRRRRELYQLYHAERMAAIEKGIELPPLPTDFFKDTRVREAAAVRHRRMGLTLLLIGASVGAALWGTGNRGAWWGLVPAAWGLALLLSSRFEAKEQASAPGSTNLGRDSGGASPPSS